MKTGITSSTHVPRCGPTNYSARAQRILTFGATVCVVILSGCGGDRIADPGTGPGAHGGWQWQNPYPPGGWYRGVHAFGSDTAVAVSNRGYIYGTKNGGNSWSRQQLPCKCDFSAVCFPTPENGWVVSTSGAIYRTTDGGTVWRETLPLGNSYEDVWFTNKDTGFICGSRSAIFRTVNGGATWDTIALAPQEGLDVYLYSIFALSDSVIWMSGNLGVILSTRDGGLTWSRRDRVGGLNNKIFFTSDSVGYITELTGHVFKTVNRGLHWSIIHRAPGWLHSMAFLDANRGWVVGEHGYIAYTSDAGATWTQVSETIGTWLNSIFITSNGVGWLVGDGGFVLRTDPGQTEWKSLTKGVQKDLYGVVFADRHNGWVVGEGGTILHTHDGGGQWEPQISGFSSVLFSVATTSRNLAWAVGDSGTILHTDNAGWIWNRQSSGTTAILLRVAFADENRGWAGGSSGTLLETTDGGNQWTLLERMGEGWVWSIFPKKDGTLWVAGRGFLKTRDRGGVWATVESLGGNLSQRQFMHVQFISDQVGWIIEWPGQIWSTKDGGKTWDFGYIHTLGNYLTGWLVEDGSVAWVVGEVYLGDYPPFMEYARRDLTDWTLVPREHYNSNYGIFFIDSRRGWIVGENGMILHTTTGGL